MATFYMKVQVVVSTRQVGTEVTLDRWEFRNRNRSNCQQIRGGWEPRAHEDFTFLRSNAPPCGSARAAHDDTELCDKITSVFL